MNEKVSIIVCSYNYEKYISETINSIINQTYDNWEMIIVDDGSSDNSINIIKNYEKNDSRIHLYTHYNNQNKGLAESIKLGLTKVTGEYLVFLESDDYLKNSYLQLKIDTFRKNPDIGFLYNNIELVGTKNAYFKKRKSIINEINHYWKINNFPHYVSDNFYLRNIVPTFSCVMLKTFLIKNCIFNSPKDSWIDWFLWAQISNNTKFYYINDKLTFWRVHENSYDSIDNKIKSTMSFYYELYNILKPIKSLKYKVLFFIKNILRLIKYKIIYG